METSDNRQALINAVNGVMLAVIIFAISLRIVARNISKAGFWWDDYLIFFGGVSSASPFESEELR